MGGPIDAKISFNIDSYTDSWYSCDDCFLSEKIIIA